MARNHPPRDVYCAPRVLPLPHYQRTCAGNLFRVLFPLWFVCEQQREPHSFRDVAWPPRNTFAVASWRRHAPSACGAWRTRNIPCDMYADSVRRLPWLNFTRLWMGDTGGMRRRRFAASPYGSPIHALCLYAWRYSGSYTSLQPTTSHATKLTLSSHLGLSTFCRQFILFHLPHLCQLFVRLFFQHTHVLDMT